MREETRQGRQEETRQEDARSEQTNQLTDKRSFETTKAAATSPKANSLRAFNARVHSSLTKNRTRGPNTFFEFEN